MEKKKSDRPFLSSRSVLVIELVKNRPESEGFWQVLVSQPNRPAMFTKTWPAVDGVIDTMTMKDILAYIETFTCDAIYAVTAVQQMLGAVE